MGVQRGPAYEARHRPARPAHSGRCYRGRRLVGPVWRRRLARMGASVALLALVALLTIVAIGAYQAFGGQ